MSGPNAPGGDVVREELSISLDDPYDWGTSGIMPNYAEFHNFRIRSWLAPACPHQTGFLSPKNAKRNVNEIAEFRLGNCVVEGF